MVHLTTSVGCELYRSCVLDWFRETERDKETSVINIKKQKKKSWIIKNM